MEWVSQPPSEANLEGMEKGIDMERLQVTLDDRETQIISLDRQLHSYVVSDNLKMQIIGCREDGKELHLWSNEWEYVQSQLESMES